MKIRLDILLTERGLVDSRSKAQSIIMSGKVFVEGKRVDKPGSPVSTEAEIIVEEPFPYVSRGALKIKKAYLEFNLDFRSKIICDIGSSTGGFTDFALKAGAKKVYAVDVGRGQLAYNLRQDNRVLVYEETDFRDFSASQEPIDFFLCDVSFISVKKILPKILDLASEGSGVVILIKPQFEVGKKEADRGKGVIKDELVRRGVVEDVLEFACRLGFINRGLVESPIKGAKGNVEYLVYLTLS